MPDSPFVEDPGPGFDPERADALPGDAPPGPGETPGDRPAGPGPALFEIPEVAEEKVRQALLVGGDGLHAIFGVGDYDWLATQRDIDRIAPPLTSIINRYEPARAIAGRSDELALLVGVGLWSWRSLLERAAVMREREHGIQPGAGPIPTASPTPPPAAPTSGPAPPPPSEPAPPEPAPAPQAVVGAVEVAPGYVTRAERFRQARERRPNAVPAQAPAAP